MAHPNGRRGMPAIAGGITTHVMARQVMEDMPDNIQPYNVEEFVIGNIPKRLNKKVVLANLLKRVGVTKFERMRHVDPTKNLKRVTMPTLWAECVEVKDLICLLEAPVGTQIIDHTPKLPASELGKLFSTTIDESWSLADADPVELYKFLVEHNAIENGGEDALAAFKASAEKAKHKLLVGAYTTYLQRQDLAMSGKNESQIDEAIRVCGMGLFNLRSVSTMQTHLPKVKLFLRFLINEQINGEQALVDEAGAVASALEAFASPSTPGQCVDPDGTLISFFKQVSGHPRYPFKKNP
jgi:hypothetical protein